MRRTLISLALAAIVILTGCHSTESTPTPQPSQTTATPQVTASTPTPPACESLDATEAIMDGFNQMTPPFANDPEPMDLGWFNPLEWEPELAQTFDTCAPLEAIDLHVEGATAGSPRAVMLFHEGEFLGTATLENYPMIEVSKVDDKTIRVTYRYPSDFPITPHSTSTAGASITNVSTL